MSCDESPVLNREEHAESTCLFVGHLVADLDDIRGDTILKNFDGLRSLYGILVSTGNSFKEWSKTYRDTAGEEFYKVSSVED